MLLKRKISVNLGCTLKLYPQDAKCFEFVRLDVGYEEEIHPQASVPLKYKEAWGIVEKELSESFVELRETLKDLQDDVKEIE